MSSHQYFVEDKAYIIKHDGSFYIDEIVFDACLSKRQTCLQVQFPRASTSTAEASNNLVLKDYYTRLLG
ncbi:hypothetical protein FRX31_008718 [Thalictrum thalictroides]|uniref:Uncharacterized protein n=1 Tax=Thalictrum thalictroides TaxID=46969 RepID=A0A7J6WYP6_THATH|nr:hypothetical protein FRX31_008718 [Thalictrum thalictroides]